MNRDFDNLIGIVKGKIEIIVMTALYTTYIIIVIIILIELLSFQLCALHTHTLILSMRTSNKSWLHD